MNKKQLKVILHPTIKSNCSFEHFQNFFYHKHQLTENSNITPVVTEETQENIFKKVVKNMDNPKYFDLLPEVERFVTIDSSFKDLIFNEKFSLGQIVNVKDYGWPHSNQASMDAVVTGLGFKDIYYVSPLTYDYELASNKSTILHEDDTNIGASISILKEFETPVFNTQLQKSKFSITEKAFDKIIKTEDPKNALESYTGVPLKRKADWRYMPRKIIVDTSIKLGAKASEFIMNGPNNLNEYINTPEIDFILTNDKNILENEALAEISTEDHNKILVAA